MNLKTIALVVALASFNASANEGLIDKISSYDMKDVLSSLEETLAFHDEIPTLKESKFVGRDQEAALEDLDEGLEDLIDLFDSELLSDLQDQYQSLEKRIEAEKAKQQEYRTEMVLASRDDRSLRTKLVPGETLKSMVAVSKADYEMLIEKSEDSVTEYQTEQKATLESVRQSFLAMEIDLTNDQIDVLMSSVIGNDITEMVVTFNAIKDVVTKLEQLTQQSGENLEYAKKYYGMVVVLYRLMDKVQVTFISKVDKDFLPQLVRFEKEAEDNIAASKKLISERVKVETLRNNINSNKETLKAILLYRDILKGQRDKVLKANNLTKKEMAVADNTYRTVALSSAVVGLIAEGADSFSKLMSLQIPDVREFQNTEIRETFKMLSGKISKAE